MPTGSVELDGALCVEPEYQDIFEYDWFAEENVEAEIAAKTVCDACPVRFECLQTSLSGQEVWGLWGGAEDWRRRRVLGLDSTEGKRVYSKTMDCLYCGSSKLNYGKKKIGNYYHVECEKCGLKWKTETSNQRTIRTVQRQHDKYLELGVEPSGGEE